MHLISNMVICSSIYFPCGPHIYHGDRRNRVKVVGSRSRNRGMRGLSRGITLLGLLVLLNAGALGYLATVSPTKPGDGTMPIQVTINGAGATFPFPLLSVMTVEYNLLKPSVRLNYQSIGSGGGIRQHAAKTVDFAASDAPLNEEQRTATLDTVHIPITIGAVTLTYNLPGVGRGLRVTGPLVADIFGGKVKKWNEPAIATLNPDLRLPEADILVVHRSDGSGTTFVWTSYLSLVSPDWRDTVGRGTAVQWPTGLGSSGNEGVAGLIRGTPYSIGYVELAYAHQSQMTYAAIQNREGRFVEPTLESTGAAAAEVAGSLPSGGESWTSIHLLDTPGEDSYPIASFSYLLIYRELSVLPSMSEAKARALADFLWWATHEGQSYATRIVYVPLPSSVVSVNEETIRSILFDGKPLVRS